MQLNMPKYGLLVRMPELWFKLQYSQLQDSTTNGRKFQEFTVSQIFYVCERITNMWRVLVKKVNIYK